MVEDAFEDDFEINEDFDENSDPLDDFGILEDYEARGGSEDDFDEDDFGPDFENESFEDFMESWDGEFPGED